MSNNGEILANIMKNFKECVFFLHNTKDFNVVESIMNEGFVFENQLPHSTDRLNPYETIEITYFLFQRKDYGSYTIILAIPKNVYEIYSDTAKNEDVGIEDIMTITEPYYSDNDELIYTLSPRHVLGYFNIKTSEFYQNRNWDPFFINSRIRPSSKKPARS